MSFLGKLFGNKEVVVERRKGFSERYPTNQEAIAYFEAHKALFDVFESQNGADFETLFALMESDKTDYTRHVFTLFGNHEVNNSRYVEIINKLNNNNRVVKSGSSHQILLGGNTLTKYDRILLDSYSLGKYIQFKFVDLYYKYNVTQFDMKLFSTMCDLKDSMLAKSSAVINRNKTYDARFNQLVLDLKKFTDYSRSWYLCNYNEALEKNICMDEHTFLHHLLASKDVYDEESKKLLVFDISYSHALSWKHVYEEIGNPLFLKDKTRMKELVSDKLDFFIYYYELLYSYDMDSYFTPSTLKHSELFKNTKFYGTSHLANTFRSPAWKVDSIFKISARLYSQAFFHLISHLNEASPEIISKFRISDSTFSVIVKSFDYYLESNVAGFTVDFKRHLFSILEKLVVKF